MKVLVTRPEPDATVFATLLKANGMAPIFSPVIEIEFEDKPLPDLTGVTHLAFTSANGVRALAGKTDERLLPAFLVGPATARVASKENFRCVGVADSSVSSMAKMIAAATDASSAILHVTGNHRAGDLKKELENSNRQCQRTILYTAREVIDLRKEVCMLLAQGEIQAATFFSARSAQLFLAQLVRHDLQEVLSTVRLVCLSDAIATVFEAQNAPRILVAAASKQSAMIDILQTGRT